MDLFFLGSGAVVGIILFANLLSWLLKKYYDVTIAVLVGFMIGSLNKIWPWKQTLETIVVDDSSAHPQFRRSFASIHTELFPRLHSLR